MNATPSEIVFVLLALNIFTFMVWGSDKQRARSGGRRTPESKLLMLAAVGGTPAAYLARKLLRHKSSKQPFSLYLHGITMAQIIGVGIFLMWSSASGVA